MKCNICHGAGDCPQCHGNPCANHDGCACGGSGKCPVCGGSGEFSIPYAGDLDWLVPRTILYVVHGSRAYGTSRPDSDYDYKGVVVPPAKYRDGFAFNFEQTEIKAPVDATIFGIRKFCDLAADCNPNIIEVLWAADEDILICTEQGAMLRAARKDFLSRRAVHRFRGYAMSQLKRIETHRKWLLNPPDHQPTRLEFGLPERTLIPADQLQAAMEAVRKKVDSWEIDFGDMPESEVIHVQEQIHRFLAELQIGTDERFRAAARLIGYDENFIALLDRERQYKAALDNWNHYNDWRAKRNPKRAALEAQFGYDCKHAMHLVRLMRMCREVLIDGVVHVRRPDADDLRAIRDGAWPYERLMEWANQQDTELLEVARTSPLPKTPNLKHLDEVCQQIVRSMPL